MVVPFSFCLTTLNNIIGSTGANVKGQRGSQSGHELINYKSSPNMYAVDP